MVLACPPHLDAKETAGGPRWLLQRHLQPAVSGGVRVRSPVTGMVRFLATPGARGIRPTARLSETPEARALAFLSSYGAAFGLGGTSTVQANRVHGPDAVGMTHVRLQQLYEGVPVRGGELTVHLKGPDVVAVLAKTLPVEGVDVMPRIPPAEAARVAERLLAREIGVTDAVLGTPRLEVFNRGLLDGSGTPTRLAWFIEATGPDLREFVWVDAHTGAVLLHFDQLPCALSRSIQSAYFENGQLRGRLVRAEGDSPSGDSDADRAYDYTGDTYAYFLREHGRDSFDGAGAPMIAIVHWPNLNSKWTGTQALFGLVMDDVVAHEWTHAVEQYSVEILNDAAMSSALSESYADIFGETVDLTNGRADAPGGRWWLFDDIFNGPNGTRYMMDPTVKGDPGKMSDTDLTCVNGHLRDGHHSNGVPNHAYALMVDGGTYNGYEIAGLGLTKAAKIQYRALTEYLTSISDFVDDYHALRQSCADLVGTAGITAADCAEVRKALDAVELYSPRPCPVTFTEPLDEFLCYAARPAQGARLTPFTTDLVDPFGTGSFAVVKSKAICLSAAHDGAALEDPDTQLESYEIDSLGGASEQRSGIRIVNRFGTVFVDLLRPDRLLVPAAVATDEPPSPPVFYSHGVDHYECHKVRVTRGTTPAPPKGVRTTVAEPFADRVYEVKKPSRLCAPADRSGSSVKRPRDHLMCYRVRPVGGTRRAAKQGRVLVSNKLPPTQVEVGGVAELCVPSELPVCGDARVNQPGEECDGTADTACPRGCKADCMCAVCGNDVAEPGEECDGSDVAGCPGPCRADCRCLLPPPEHDECSHARIMTGGRLDSTDTRGATISPGEPLPSCSTGRPARSVWYQYTARWTGGITLRTAGSNYPTDIAVYTGSCESLLEVACGDYDHDDDSHPEQAVLSLPVTEGTTYLIQVVADNESDRGSALTFLVDDDD